MAANTKKDDSKDPKRLVPIKLFKDNGRYKDALYVNVNDYNALIPRGKTVYVPYYVAKAIEESLEQDEQTAEMISILTEEYEQKKEFLNP